jgi:hypothetical protein
MNISFLKCNVDLYAKNFKHLALGELFLEQRLKIVI